jgi:hypothetical protein
MAQFVRVHSPVKGTSELQFRHGDGTNTHLLMDSADLAALAMAALVHFNANWIADHPGGKTPHYDVRRYAIAVQANGDLILELGLNDGPDLSFRLEKSMFEQLAKGFSHRVGLLGRSH